MNLEKEVYKVKEAFVVLKKYGLTNSEQVVRRWIRGEVPGKELKSIVPPKDTPKVGHTIKKEDLEAFIEKHANPLLFAEKEPVNDTKVTIEGSDKEESEDLVKFKEKYETMRKWFNEADMKLYRSQVENEALKTVLFFENKWDKQDFYTLLSKLSKLKEEYKESAQWSKNESTKVIQEKRDFELAEKYNSRSYDYLGMVEKIDAIFNELNERSEELQELQESYGRISYKSGWEEAVIQKVKETKKPFDTLTEQDYDRYLFTMASLWNDTNKQQKKIMNMEKEIEQLKLLAGKVRISENDRKVLRGIGFSIGDIERRLPDKEETVSGLTIKKIGFDRIDVAFRYEKADYKAEVVPVLGNWKEELDYWRIARMTKVETNRQASEAKEQKVVHDGVMKTFQLLYDLEQKYDKNFYYLADDQLRK